MRCKAHVAYMGETRNAYKMLIHKVPLFYSKGKKGKGKDIPVTGHGSP
jgi:hypothetical protein